LDKSKSERVSEISAARTGESAGGMEDDLRHAQSAETLPLRMEFPERLKELTQPTKDLFRTVWPVSKAQKPALGDRESAKGKI
jgi:hypothetical protein